MLPALRPLPWSRYCPYLTGSRHVPARHPRKASLSPKTISNRGGLGNDGCADAPIGKRDGKKCHRHPEGNRQTRWLIRVGNKSGVQWRRLLSVRSACRLLAHSCPGRVRRHVRSWRKPTPHSCIPGGWLQLRRPRSFLMISRRLFAYSSIVRRTSAARDGLASFAASLPGFGFSSGGFITGRCRTPAPGPLS